MNYPVPTPLLDKLLNVPMDWTGIPADLADAAREFARKTHAEKTTRCYEGILIQWIEHCGSIDAAFPAMTPMVVAWIAKFRLRGLSALTIRNKLIVLATVHRANGWPTIYTRPVRHALKSALMSGPSIRNRKRPLTQEHRLAISVVLKRDRNRLRAARDRAILWFGFGGALRRSEVASAKLEDLELHPDGLVYYLSQSKGDPYGMGQSVSIRADGRVDLCPIRALATWIRMANIATGPIFREIRSDGSIGQEALSPDAVSDIVKTYAGLIGLDTRFYAGHSLRRGWATHANKTGASLTSIQRH